MNEQPDSRPEDETQSFPAPEESSLTSDDEETDVGPESASPEQAAAEPPRIVAETPVGGLRPAAQPVSSPPTAAEPAEPPAEEAHSGDAAALTPSDETIRLTLADVAPAPAAEQELSPSFDLEAAKEEAEEAPAMAESATEAEEIELAAPPAATDVAPPSPAAAEEVALPAEPTPVSLVNAALAAVAAQPEEAPAEAPESAITSPQEWDEDLSPELAAVLFGSPRRAAVESARSVAETAAPPAAVTPAAAIALTRDEQAATLPLSAGGQRAAAPDATLTGKVRHTRVEEPLPGDRGQHIVETWDYFKPELPALEGRLVQRVTREEWRYSDGSWRWRYERRYADRGRDSREVRANAARTYFERADSISQRDATSGKRQQFSEEAVLIFAAPVQEEKRGWLRNLFRRGNDHEPAGEKTWRPATAAEIRQARKSGEQALRRGGLFG